MSSNTNTLVSSPSAVAGSSPLDPSAVARLAIQAAMRTGSISGAANASPAALATPSMSSSATVLPVQSLAAPPVATIAAPVSSPSVASVPMIGNSPTRAASPSRMPLPVSSQNVLSALAGSPGTPGMSPSMMLPTTPIGTSTPVNSGLNVVAALPSPQPTPSPQRLPSPQTLPMPSPQPMPQTLPMPSPQRLPSPQTLPMPSPVRSPVRSALPMPSSPMKPSPVRSALPMPSPVRSPVSTSSPMMVYPSPGAMMSSSPSQSLPGLPRPSGLSPVASPVLPKVASPGLSPVASPVLPTLSPMRSTPAGGSVQLPLPSGVVPGSSPASLSATSSPYMSPLRVFPVGNTVQPVVGSAGKIPTPASFQSHALTPVGTPMSLPLPGSPGSSSPFAEAMSSADVSSKLIKHGYIPMDSLTLSNKTQFVKCKGPRGNCVFVDVTAVQSGISVQLGARTSVAVVQGQSISRDLVMSVAECAAAESCGAMFDCNDQYCYVRKADNGQIESSTFVVSHREGDGDTRINPLGSPIAFPAVTLAQIETDPVGILNHTSKVYAQIVQSATTSMKQMFERIRTQAASLTSRINMMAERYQTFQTRFFQNYNRATEIALKFEARSQKDGGLVAEDAMRHKAVVDIIEGLNNMFIETLSFVNGYSRTEEELTRLNIDAGDAIMGLYIKLHDKRFSADVLQKESWDPKIWGLPAEYANVCYDDLVAGRLPKTEETEAVVQLKRVLGSTFAK